MRPRGTFYVPATSRSPTKTAPGLAQFTDLPLVCRCAWKQQQVSQNTMLRLREVVYLLALLPNKLSPGP